MRTTGFLLSSVSRFQWMVLTLLSSLRCSSFCRCVHETINRHPNHYYGDKTHERKHKRCLVSEHHFQQKLHRLPEQCTSPPASNCVSCLNITSPSIPNLHRNQSGNSEGNIMLCAHLDSNTPNPFLNVLITNASSLTSPTLPFFSFFLSALFLKRERERKREKG